MWGCRSTRRQQTDATVADRRSARGDAAKAAYDDKRVDDLATHVHVGPKYARVSADDRSIGYEQRAYEKQAGPHIRMSLRTSVETRVGMVARRKQRNEWRCLVIPMILAFR
jgi:hypothetical protein